jgi:SAM-dependent methyltransferase
MKINYNNNYSDLCLIGKKYDTDKTPLRINVNRSPDNKTRHAHPYTLYYNSIFKNIKNDNLNILEFGILEGASLLMWKEYFCNSKIVGLDNNTYYINKMKEQNFDISYVNVNDEISISSTLNSINMMFDIIIEDTTHQTDDQRRVIKNAVKYLKPGGIMIIEDIYIEINEEYYYEILGEETLNEFQNYYFITLDHENKYSEGWDNDKLFVLIKKGAEPIIKNKNKITIITSSYRIQNLKKLYETINFDYVDEWIIVYDGSKITENPKLFNHEKIKEYIHKNENSSFGNAQRNFALDNIKNENTYLYYLDDNNLINPEIYKLLDIIDDDKIYTFNLINYPSLELMKGNEFEFLKINTAMMLISYKLCKDIKWNIYECTAYFRYINECYNKNKDKWIYIDNVLAYHNKII